MTFLWRNKGLLWFSQGMMEQKLILIGGPTASGKSALALDLACQYDGAILNADALQVYAGLPLLSAQPSSEDRARVPHRLYGVTDPAEPSSAGKWRAQAMAALSETVSAGKTPIFVGGTGLYFRALLGGLDDIPPIPDAVRAEASRLYDELGERAFRERLAAKDPDSVARLARNDRQRLVRAYEVVLHTGRPLSQWHGQKGEDEIFVVPASGVRLRVEKNLLLPERDTLYAACESRFLTMMERGALAEVEAFLERKLDPALPVMKTIGVRELGAYLAGEISLKAALEKAQQLTRNYAKRQMTWFRNQWVINP